MKAVFDTNIYIAAILKTGLCTEILNLALSPDSPTQVYISEAILEELLIKLEDFEKKKLVSKRAIEDLINTIRQFTEVLEPTEFVDVVKNDKDDNKILECALAAEANLIVTMDKDLLKIKQFKYIAIIHPTIFVYMLPKSLTD